MQNENSLKVYATIKIFSHDQVEYEINESNSKLQFPKYGASM